METTLEKSNEDHSESKTFELQIQGKIWNYKDEPSREVISFFQSRRGYCLTVEELTEDQKKMGIPREFDCGNAVCQLTNNSCERHANCPIHSVYCKDCHDDDDKGNHVVSYSFPYHMFLNGDVRVRKICDFIMRWFIHEGTKYGRKKGLILASEKRNLGKSCLADVFAGNDGRKVVHIGESSVAPDAIQKAKDKISTVILIDGFSFPNNKKSGKWCWLKKLSTGQLTMVRDAWVNGPLDARRLLPLITTNDVETIQLFASGEEDNQFRDDYCMCIVDRYIGPPDKNPELKSKNTEPYNCSEEDARIIRSERKKREKEKREKAYRLEMKTLKKEELEAKSRITSLDSEIRNAMDDETSTSLLRKRKFFLDSLAMTTKKQKKLIEDYDEYLINKE